MLLKASNIRVIAGEKNLLDNVSVSIDKGESVCVVGPNGAGKSTLLRCLAGITTSNSGAVLLNKQAIKEMRRLDIAKSLSYLPQNSSNQVPMTASDLVGLGRFRNPASPDASFERLKISHLQSRTVSTLSGGEFQLVLLAQALHQDAALMLLDEPTGPLDLKRRHQIFELCKQLTQEGKSIVATSHHLEVATQYFDRIIVLDKGTVKMDAQTSSVVSSNVLQEVFGLSFQQVTIAGKKVLVSHAS